MNSPKTSSPIIIICKEIWQTLWIHSQVIHHKQNADGHTDEQTDEQKVLDKTKYLQLTTPQWAWAYDLVYLQSKTQCDILLWSAGTNGQHSLYIRPFKNVSGYETNLFRVSASFQRERVREIEKERGTV